jgi:hypothetical protein
MFHRARWVHRISSVVLCLMSLVHSGFTAIAYERWTPGAAWFLGTGLGLLFLGVMNIAHVGVEPCRMPTAPPVRWANWVAALFGIGAAIAVPQPQAYVVLASLLLVAVSGQWTLLGPSRHDHDA